MKPITFLASDVVGPSTACGVATPYERSTLSGGVPVAYHCTRYDVSNAPYPSGRKMIAAGGAGDAAAATRTGVSETLYT